MGGRGGERLGFTDEGLARGERLGALLCLALGGFGASGEDGCLKGIALGRKTGDVTHETALGEGLADASKNRGCLFGLGASLGESTSEEVDLDDKVVDQLIMAFRLFSELGVHKSAAATAYMNLLRDGAILANSGHFDAEIDLKALREMAEGHVREVRDNVQEFEIGRKRLHLVAEGRLVNLGAAEGHPAAVMDMSFANQALGAEYIVKNYKKLEKKVYPVPADIDKEIARLKLSGMGVAIDTLTAEQKNYLASWEMGT